MQEITGNAATEPARAGTTPVPEDALRDRGAAPRRSGRGRGPRDAARRGGRAALLSFLPFGFLLAFGGIPIVLSLLLVLGHLGGPNRAVSELGQNEISGRGIGTLGAVIQVLRDHTFDQSVLATVVVLLVTSVLVLAVSLALTVRHRIRPSRPGAVLQFLSVVPLFIPVVIASFSLWTFWGDRGFADSLGQVIGLRHAFVESGTLRGVVIGEVWVSLPFAVLLLRSGLASMSDSSLDAARDAGAGTFVTALRIVVPQLRRECAVVFCFTAVGVLGSFTVPYIIGPSSPVLLGVDSVNTFASYNEPQQAAVIGFAIFVLAAVIGCAYAVGSRRRHVPAR